MTLAGKCTQHTAGAQKLALVGMEMAKKKTKTKPHDHCCLRPSVALTQPHGGCLLWKVSRLILQLPATYTVNTPTSFSSANYIIKTK